MLVQDSPLLNEKCIFPRHLEGSRTGPPPGFSGFARIGLRRGLQSRFLRLSAALYEPDRLVRVSRAIEQQKQKSIQNSLATRPGKRNERNDPGGKGEEGGGRGEVTESMSPE